MKVKEVEAGFRIGGKVQVKKFDISSDYEYSASQRAELDPDDDPAEAIISLTDDLKALLEPQAQADFDSLWGQRVNRGE
jgi:hypothetical protein